MTLGGDSCPICYEADTELHPLVVLECKHALCESCYQSWHLEQRHAHCCICRQDVDLPPALLPPQDTVLTITEDDNHNNHRDIIEITICLNSGLCMALGTFLIILGLIFFFNAIHSGFVAFVMVSLFVAFMALPYAICIYVCCGNERQVLT